jgi:hypothetical protein
MRGRSLLLLLVAQSAAVCDIPPVCDVNKTTSQCGHTFTGCNVCDSCCNWGGKANCPGCLQANKGCVSYECSDSGETCQPVEGDSGTYTTQAACDANCKAPPRKHECNPSSAQGCTNCSPCCKFFIADGADCDSCVNNICINSRQVFWVTSGMDSPTVNGTSTLGKGVSVTVGSASAGGGGSLSWDQTCTLSNDTQPLLWMNYSESSRMGSETDSGPKVQSGCSKGQEERTNWMMCCFSGAGPTPTPPTPTPPSPIPAILPASPTCGQPNSINPSAQAHARNAAATTSKIAYARPA